VEFPRSTLLPIRTREKGGNQPPKKEGKHIKKRATPDVGDQPNEATEETIKTKKNRKIKNRREKQIEESGARGGNHTKLA